MKEKIEQLGGQLVNEAQSLVHKARGMMPEVISAYDLMADSCREYYNGFNIENYTARVSVYAVSALNILEAYGKPITKTAQKKLMHSINELQEFSNRTWREAQEAGVEARKEELTTRQKLFAQQAADLITAGIVTVSVVATGVIAVTAVAAIGISIMAAAVVVSSPVLFITGSLLLITDVVITASSPHIAIIAAVTLPPICSLYNDVCTFKEKNPQHNLTPHKLYDILNEKDHIREGNQLLDEKITSAIAAINGLSKNIAQLLESGLKKAIVAKEVTKSVGKNLSNAVGNSKVGKTANRAKSIIQRSANTVKAKFTEKLKLAREKVEQGTGSPSRK